MFILFVCLSHRGRLIGVKLVKMPKHKLVRNFSTDRALYSDKARSFSQSERALYRNFIIINNKNTSDENMKLLQLNYLNLSIKLFASIVGQPYFFQPLSGGRGGWDINIERGPVRVGQGLI